ncbi:LemA family protein [Malacoplasma muris]|uniref:LemA family protein n=1 Tax=Malacoplasma muris TaxID=2119 RepID=UPI00398E6276
MLVDTRKPANPQGTSLNVDNTEIVANPTSGQKTLFNVLIFFSWFPLILPGIIWWVNRIKKRNVWVEKQMEVNNAAAAIDVNLTKRADTLIKLLEQTKGYLKHEKETLTNITKMRSSGAQATPADIQAKDQAISSLARNINIQLEAYPDLKGSSVIGELMSSSQYIEGEIAASRRLYNQIAQRFNADILTFPNICIAYKDNLRTFPLFSASEEQKKDVDMSKLSEI